MTLSLPRRSESDVGQADASPNKEVGETRQRQEPVKNGTSILCLSDESEKSEKKLDNDTPDRSTVLVYLCQESWSHPSLSKSLHCASRSESARVSNTDNGDGDDNIKD